jgi:CRP-like cAMP-binding protein
MASTTEIRERRIYLHARLQQKVYTRPLDLDPALKVDIPSYSKTKEEVSFLTSTLQSNFVFSDLSEKEISLLVDAFQKENIKADEIIIRQGDTTCDSFYILQFGSIKFIKDGEEEVFRCEDGGAFGELELLYDFPRAVTVQAVQDSTLWKVDQHTFRYLLGRYSVEKEQSAADLRLQSPLFEDIDSETLSKFAKSFTTVKFKKGDQIITKGDAGEVFYIVQKGSVKVTDIGTGTSPMVDQTLSEGKN